MRQGLGKALTRIGLTMLVLTGIAWLGPLSAASRIMDLVGAGLSVVVALAGVWLGCRPAKTGPHPHGGTTVAAAAMNDDGSRPLGYIEAPAESHEGHHSAQEAGARR